MEKENEIKRIIGELESSPMFQLSLSSKELFHSNFWYWLIKHVDEEFGNAFFSKDKLDITKITEIYR